jgi:hypothetical protein
MPRSPNGRAVARGLDAGLHLQHAFMPAGYASLKTAQVNQKCRLTVITVSTAPVACASQQSRLVYVPGGRTHCRVFLQEVSATLPMMTAFNHLI